MIACAILVAHFEAAPLRHLSRILLGIRRADPAIDMLVLDVGRALDLKLKERARPQEPMHVADVTLDNFPAGDVLKHEE